MYQFKKQHEQNRRNSNHFEMSFEFDLFSIDNLKQNYDKVISPFVIQQLSNFFSSKSLECLSFIDSEPQD